MNASPTHVQKRKTIFRQHQNSCWPFTLTTKQTFVVLGNHSNKKSWHIIFSSFPFQQKNYRNYLSINGPPKTSWHLFTISCHLPISFFSFYSFSFCDFPLFFISKVNIFIWYWNCVAFIWQQTKRDEKNCIKENLLFFACIIISREEKESSMILTKNTSFMRCNRMDFIW